jgi:dTDP-4-amino-4,6-dideoxygalactose transaminase
MQLADRYSLLVVEDAAQAIDSYYDGRALGSFGHFGCFSFHETKNIQSGEGGLLVINDKKYERRAEIIWEKGTNRAEFFRGEVNKYNWIDIGSSFLPSDMIAAFLYAQLENIDDIQNRRKRNWKRYYDLLRPLADKGYFSLPYQPEHADNPAHMFYILCDSPEERNGLIDRFKDHGIRAVSHYISLHKSPFYLQNNSDNNLPNSERYTDCLVRLPLYYSLTQADIEEITELIENYFHQ